ncbi:hypothetical protein L3Y34_012790 [Caenorhabditis briggsae]|uniref:Uncharacterized protein n=1 Tax=Caenorhabditis briggsae TaxID=6238 RepID=A0AAE9CX21_CAEBR|nr:hypothetical protein L3Y34_012790 [Caenorhabditis briggsae]
MAVRTAKRDDRNQSKEVVRFRRWIAMTPDSKWREFRGTADMVDVGRGANLVELVDKMMGSRIELYTQFLDGWKTMRSGLSEENATWIFSEMISGMVSLKKFEIENFSKKNKWATPNKREAFPLYLSDRPVKDGSLTVEAKPMFELDKQIEMICGPSFPKALVSELKLKMNIADIARTSQKRRFGQEVNGSGNEPSTSNSVEKNQESSRNQNRSKSQQPTTSSNRMVTIREMDVALQETPVLKRTEVQSNQGLTTSNSAPAESRPRSRKMCSGFGLMFDGNGQTRITVSRTSSFDGGRLRMIPNRAEVPQQPSEFFPALKNVVQNESTNDQPKLMGILVTRNEKGEYIPIGLTPLTVSQLTSGNRQILQNVVLEEPVTELELVTDSRSLEPASPSRVDPRRPEDDRLSTNAVCSGSTTSDSGLSSTSEQGHASTRSSSPGSKVSQRPSEKAKKGKQDVQNSGLSSPSEQSNVSTRSSSRGNKNCSSGNEKTEGKYDHSTELNTLSEYHQKARPQSYASVVSSHATRDYDRTNTPALAVASSSSTSVAIAANLLGDEKEEETLVMSLRQGNIGRKPSDDSWIVVKPKNPLETNESLFPTSSLNSRLCEPSTSYAVSKNSRIEKPNALNDVAENWDNVVVDEQAEKEHELKRLKRQSHRAAKFKKEKEEKRASRSEQSRHVEQKNLMAAHEEPIIEEQTSENTVRTVALYAPLTSNLNLMSLINAHNAPKEEYQGTYDPVTQQYSDGHIFHEYADEIETGKNRQPKDLIFETSELHAKLVFRLLWFENKKKLDKCIVDDATRIRLQDALSMVRTMKDRIDMAGQMLVWRITHINLSSMKEFNIVSIVRNLIDVQRQHFENDLMMARTMGDLVDEGKLVKNFVYEKHVFTILKLPELLVPKLKEGNANSRTYQDITTLVLLFTKRVEKLYEEFGKLYEFKVVKDRQRGRRGY